MMFSPRLTIGIPTYNRPDRLPIAIASAIGQSMPARVLIADQTGMAESVVRPFLQNPLVQYLKTDATCLWENWTAAVENCRTELFAWLQDDDLVAPHFSLRVQQGFDAFPTASVYLARLGISSIDGIANWWQSTGPMFPMDLLHGLPCRVAGLLIVAGGYFNSFALSPGMAFRHSPEAIAAVRRCPKDCEIYNERIVIAELASHSDVICDPAMVGYWVQHEDNESKRLVRAGGRTSQYPILVERLDSLLKGREADGWEDMLRGWALLLGSGVVEHWLKDHDDLDLDSYGLKRSRTIFREALDKMGRPYIGDPNKNVDDPVRNGHVETAVNPRPARAHHAVKKGR
jgi:hypothetical protein